jgi:hypothetical protein
LGMDKFFQYALGLVNIHINHLIYVYHIYPLR